MICESNMEIIKTIGMIGAVTIFYFSPIPLVVAGLVGGAEAGISAGHGWYVEYDMTEE